MTLFTALFVFGYLIPSVISLISFVIFSIKYGDKETDEDTIVGAFSCVFPVFNIGLAMFSLLEWGIEIYSRIVGDK